MVFFDQHQSFKPYSKSYSQKATMSNHAASEKFMPMEKLCFQFSKTGHTSHHFKMLELQGIH